MSRLAQSLPKATPLPANAATENYIRRVLHKGAIQARVLARTRSQRAQCGNFSVFVAYMDTTLTFFLLVHQEVSPGSKVYHAAIRSEDGFERIHFMGSGLVAAMDYMAALERHRQETFGKPVEGQEIRGQSGLLGLALLDILMAHKAPLSGGGVQAMYLTRDGVQKWELWSTVPEYLDDRSVDPDWQKHGPQVFIA